MDSLYDHPDLYYLVEARRDDVLDEESGQLLRLFAEHGIGPGSRVLELCCGTCPHGFRLLEKGYAVTGIDRSQAMLDEAARLARNAGHSIELYRSDVCDFSLPHAQFDAVIFMYETFPVICADEDLRRHFDCVRRHIRPGGLYVIDKDFHTGGTGSEYAVWNQRTIEIDGGTIEVWNESWPGDVINGLFHFAFHSKRTRNGEVLETCDDIHVRVDSLLNLRWLVATLDGWAIERFCPWHDIESAPRREDKHCWMVLRAE